MTDPVPHREPHQRAANIVQGAAIALRDDYTTALRTARRAAHTPPDSITASGTGVRSVGTHSDPTASAAIGASVDHPLAHRVTELHRAMNDIVTAASHLLHLIENTLDHDRRTLDRMAAAEELRATQPVHRYCFACDTPIDAGNICGNCKKLRQRTDPTDYVAHHADQSPAALDAAFTRWVQQRIAQGTLQRPGSPHARIGERVIIHEHEVA